MEADARLILACGTLLVAGLLVWLVADRFRAPSLVLFLVLGMAIGSDGAGGIHFGFRPEDYLLTRLLGTVRLAVILFDARLGSGFREIPPGRGSRRASGWRGWGRRARPRWPRTPPFGRFTWPRPGG